MLELAIKAGIPIIRVATTDVLNVGRVIECIAPKNKYVREWSHSQRAFQEGDIFYAIEDPKADGDAFAKLAEDGKVLILVNCGEDNAYAFDAGEVPVPVELTVEYLENMVPKKEIPGLLPAFKGLTLKTSAEVMRLCFTQDKKLTPRAVSAMRSRIAGSLQGLQQVDTHLPVYIPAKEVVEWIELNRSFFLTPTNPELIPRGVLFNGEPGVGKSQGAKFIANEYGIPLYRLDISSAQSKWRGESEQNLSRALAMLDQEAPAVVLIDEAEKYFGSDREDGGASGLLAQLLFWLQEHKSRVLTVITTNNMDKLPPELYREGRIDLTITLPLLNYADACFLAGKVYAHLMSKPLTAGKVQLHAAIKAATMKAAQDKPAKTISHAAVTHIVHTFVKQELKS